MKFVFATIHVRNLEDSIRFYEEVIGLRLARRFPGGPHSEIAFMDGGAAEIELICDHSADSPACAESPSLGLSVDNLDLALERMRDLKVAITSGPFQPNPFTRFFFIKDPDGVSLEIIERNEQGMG